jgi:hypothetical protein
MKRLLLLFALLFSGLSAATHVDDPGKLLPADAAWIKALDDKLDSFERTAGIKVLVQIHLKSPAEEEDKVAGAYMSALATKLGVIQHGVLMVYFVDDPDWRMWIGDELTPVFVGKPGTAKTFTASGEMHEAKEAFLKATFAKADAAFAALPKGTPAQHLALQTDALVDGLIAKLAPK